MVTPNQPSASYQESLNPQSIAELEHAVECFSALWAKVPTHGVVSPGRVNLIGEHVDYSGGWVLPCAIERRISMVGVRRTDTTIRLASTYSEAPVTLSISELSGPPVAGWARYVQGVLAILQDRGYAVCGFDAFVESTIPIGGGLSSSAALEAAAGLLMLAFMGQSMASMDLARICQQAEHEYAGVPCGIMDQAAVLSGREDQLILLDCETETVSHSTFDLPDWALMIINTGVAHELASGEYGMRRAGCDQAAKILGVSSLGHITLTQLDSALKTEGLDESMCRYLRHVVTENDRTLRAAKALAEGDVEGAGTLFYASHASLQFDFRVSCPELDFIVEESTKLKGVAGCRMTGGGFGGSAIALVRRDSVDSVGATLRKCYAKQFGFEPSIFLTKPAQGAEVFRL